MAGAAIRAVLFDVDDTLVDHSRAQRAGLEAAMAAEGRRCQESDHERWRELVEWTFARYLSGELSFAEQRRVRVRAMAGRALSDVQADLWVERYLAGFEQGLALYDDVLPALDALACLPAVRVGAFSNVDGDFTRRKLAVVGIADRFDVVLGTSDVGAAKPAADPFWALCRALGVEPGQALHVGDRWHGDAWSARNAGLIGVWLDRPGADPGGRRPPAGSSAADLRSVPVIASLAQLQDLVRPIGFDGR